MRRFLRAVRCRLPSLLGIALWLSWANVALAAGGKPAKKLVNVADTRGLEPGLTKFIADLYNGPNWIFGLFAVAVMAGMGLVLGWGCDRIMAMLGINLGRMQHHE